MHKALLDEMRLETVKHQEDVKKRYDKQLKKRVFRPGDWVFKRVVCLQDQEKLDENWTCPYIINLVAS